MTMTEKKLSHLNQEGKAHMVDVGGKPVTERVAVAKGQVEMRSETMQLIKDGQMKKGDIICYLLDSADDFSPMEYENR